MSADMFQEIIAINEEVSIEKPTPSQDCADGLTKFDERFHLVDHDENPLPNMYYRVSASTGEIFEGISDMQGFTLRIKTRFSANLKIEVFESVGGINDNFVDE
jgi:uncharacterized protein (DUF2345 family)